MSLKTSNKNRKKVVVEEITPVKDPMKSWWWFPSDYKLYVVGLFVVSLVAVFL